MPIRALLQGWPSVEQARLVIHKSTKFYIKLLEWLGLITVEIKGFEHAKLNSGMILIANHSSLLDIVFFLSIFPNCSCIAKKGLLYFSPYALIIRWAGYAASAGGNEIVEQANSELQNNRPFVIFPEGTRKSHSSQKHGAQEVKFKRGAAALVLKSKAPVVPVIFKYSPPVLGKNRRWRDAPDRICQVNIEFFPAIYFHQVQTDKWIQRREITKKLEDFFGSN